MEMNNINGYNKAKQQTESEFNFHHIKSFVVSPIIHSFHIDLEKIFNLIFKSERASKFRNQALLRFTQSGFEALWMIKRCLQPTQSSFLFNKFSLRCLRLLQHLLQDLLQYFLHGDNFESPVSCPSFLFNKFQIFATSFTRSWQGFLHRNNFKIQSSNSNTTLYYENKAAQMQLQSRTFSLELLTIQREPNRLVQRRLAMKNMDVPTCLDSHN